MNKILKAGAVLWIMVSIISLLSAAGLSYFMLQERTKRIETEQKLSETEKSKRAVEIKLKRSQSKLIQVNNQAELLAKELAQEKRNHLTALQELDKRDLQLRELENNLANEKEERTNLTNALDQLRERYAGLEEKLKDRAGVRLEKIVVKPKKELSGKVLVVNREFHFVVIDLGRKDGVSVADEFIIYQDFQEIGKVQIEKVYSAMSSASILPGSQEHKINENSIVQSF